MNLDKFRFFFFFVFAFKGYTCRFKSETFASFFSIALRPWLVVSNLFLSKIVLLDSVVLFVSFYDCSIRQCSIVCFFLRLFY